MENNNLILEAVSSARKQAELAMKDFDRKSAEIERLASRNIDLFGSNAVSRVTEIAEKSRDACDGLYVTLQALVVLVDEKCKPLVNDDTPAETIKEITSCISYLNSESKIKNNFTASLNNSAKSDVAQVTYIPSLNNQVIEKYWSNLYETLPEVIQRKIEEEKKTQQADYDKKVHLEKLRVEYKTAIVKYSKEVERIEKLREEEIAKEVEKLGCDEIDKCNEKYKENERRYRVNLEAKQKEIEEETRIMESLGKLAFIKKNACKQNISALSVQVHNFEEKIKANEREHQSELSKVKSTIAAEKQKITLAVKERYPLPEKPKQPKELRFYGLSPSEIAFESIKDSVYEFLLKQKNGKSIEYITSNCPVAADLSYKYLSGMLNSMKLQGMVKITKGKNGYLYKAIEEQ